jgi:hypothetical protein
VAINDLDICWSGTGPSEANAPLIVDAHAVLSLAAAFQLRQAIAVCERDNVGSIPWVREPCGRHDEQANQRWGFVTRMRCDLYR